MSRPAVVPVSVLVPQIRSRAPAAVAVLGHVDLEDVAVDTLFGNSPLFKQ